MRVLSEFSWLGVGSKFAGSCVQFNTYSGYMKGEEFSDYVQDCQLLKKIFAPD